MTCIAAVVDSAGNVCMGGDSAAVCDYDILTINAPKVFLKRDIIFGFAGHFRFGQIIQHAFKCPRLKGRDVDEFLATTFADAVRDTVKKIGYSRTKEGREEGGTALMAIAGRLFIMQDEFDFIEARDGIAALGCGSAYALGSLKSSTGPVAERIEQALGVSAFYCAGVRAPFTIITVEGTNGPRPGTNIASPRDSGRNRKQSAGAKKRHA